MPLIHHFLGKYETICSNKMKEKLSKHQEKDLGMKGATHEQSEASHQEEGKTQVRRRVVNREERSLKLETEGRGG